MAWTSTFSIVKASVVTKALSVSRPWSSTHVLLGLLSMCGAMADSTPAIVPVSLRSVNNAGEAVAVQPIVATSFIISSVSDLFWCVSASKTISAERPAI